MFVHTEAFLQLQEDEKFIALASKFDELKYIEDNRPDQTPDDDLEPEDDYGNVEYKLKLCDMTMFKINKRTTQMQFRLYVSAIRFHFVSRARPRCHARHLNRFLNRARLC